MKKLLVLVIFVILIIINSSGCVQPSGSIVQDFKFNSGEGRCGGRNEADMELKNNKIIFSGFIGASTPCHKLKASYSINRVEFTRAPTTDVITITITKEPVGEVCIECIGEVSFSGEMTINREMWDSGHYGVEIVHEGKELTGLYSYVT